MAVNMSRSERQSLLEGATDGSYRKIRPDTEPLPLNTTQIMHARQHLNPYFNYGHITEEIPLHERSIPGT